jgi:hypothetical protein
VYARVCERLRLYYVSKKNMDQESLRGHPRKYGPRANIKIPPQLLKFESQNQEQDFLLHVYIFKRECST